MVHRLLLHLALCRPTPVRSFWRSLRPSDGDRSNRQWVWTPISSALVQKRPDDPRRLIGLRDRCNLEGPSGVERLQPRPRPSVVSGDPQDGCCPDDEESAEFRISHLRYSSQPLFASA